MTTISALPYRSERLEERFWAKVEETDDCWLWKASTCGEGYGQFYIRSDKRRPYMALAHRVAYELLVGEIPEGLTIDHLCRNRLCVNPEHLEPVTLRENVQRGVPRNARKTHCPKGHRYDRTETWRKRDGTTTTARRCSTCRTEQERRRWR